MNVHETIYSEPLNQVTMLPTIINVVWHTVGASVEDDASHQRVRLMTNRSDNGKVEHWLSPHLDKRERVYEQSKIQIKINSMSSER